MKKQIVLNELEGFHFVSIICPELNLKRKCDKHLHYCHIIILAHFLLHSIHRYYLTDHRPDEYAKMLIV